MRCLAMVAMLICAPLNAQPVPEYDLKAAFIYNFALFTEWPAEAFAENAPLNVCASSHSTLRAALTGLNDKPLKGRKVAIKPLSGLDGLAACHVLFIDGSERERWAQIKRRMSDLSLLTVTDDAEIARDGAIISMALENNRLVFDIDTRAARQSRLILSSKLLRLARVVQ